ncbi:chaperone modulator CbpM [Kordiimonas marina]|uniref:chaperone modulator CbpM n=1 Tax=Kordiimonas marina TaxID=2872312 RepID=UPI001FF3BCCF|nr:chaperone modulator CbpM [Kordiimonas marina]MCJ9428816.1 chaperone modulator CbpM [Kordiimonas marina]
MTEQDVIARVRGLTRSELHLCIERGWVKPALSPEGQCFNEIDIARLDFIRHLQADLAANEEAVPFVLSLIDQVHGLRHALKTITVAVEAQDEDVRNAVRSALLEAFDNEK